ncbi:hypothetical protein LXM25_20685 [Dyadobacter sp. LJ53]|uniref:CBU_0592 family membrane protein n=1 Tax=Dyadobacter chenwenxiniae TaxID=2906456 RepID=UPI001F38201A|nr:hypothetical protein [Dyadobacter chenwenxiniae]MCF0052499.1 hypothetical protein [Dyadobacter chenwenxiniae]
MNQATWIETIGWAGAIFYVLAYLLLTAGILKSSGYNFHFLNMLGAAGLIVDSYYHADNPNLAVNSIWLVIGIFAVIKRFSKRSNR